MVNDIFHMLLKSSCRFLFFAFVAFALASCASKKGAVVKRNMSLQNDVVDYSKKYLNKPYQYAGKGPNAFDCSGYTSFVFKQFGYNLNASSAGQANQGVTIRRKEELEIGDLVFFEGSRHDSRVGHVGIVSDIGHNGKFNFIHASTSNGVIITSSEEPYYKARYLRGSRILKDVSKKAESQESSNQDNYIKSQDHITYQETNEGFVTIQKGTSKPLEGGAAVSTEQPSKPKKNKKEEDDDKQSDNGKIRQFAITTTEETILPTSIHISHKVKPGETLFSISQKHNCSVEQLKKWNPKIVNNDIRAGDVINIHQ